ncbi:unnamed protein product [Didymodactylos carnosus]|uniref:Reverse transcriptase domain-containing protein n=1 Tax=Didymodactylos carnosus TaxID=1234261 RepID=A0A813YRG1_9BILA|nr:unnamed protein product [Didymodactylos carnosus]CAF3672936.1 unnamed protein product [Didymodactylos carnosus]
MRIGSVTYVKISSHMDNIVGKEKDLLRTRHNNKLRDLRVPVDNSDLKNKLVFNYSYRALTKGEESLLSHGWKYAINTKTLNSLNVKTDMEYMYYCMERNSLINKSNILKVKSMLNEFGHSIIRRRKSDIPNLSYEEIQAIETLLNDKSLVISKVDKGNAVVVLNKEDYLEKEYSVLEDKRVFKLLNDDPTDEREKQFIAFLLKLKNKNLITNDDYKRMRPDTGSRTPEAYFLVKIHKKDLPVRPIISSYDSYNYRTAKYLAELLSPAMKDGRSYLKDTFHFVDKIRENKNISGIMFSLDVSSLFTSVPLDKSIELAMIKIRQYHPKWKIDDKNLRELFYFCTKRTNFIFDHKNYDQVNGVSMGSPLAPVMANLFMNEIEKEIDNYGGKKPDLYLRYVDDVFAVIHGTQKDIHGLLKFRNKLDTRIKFTVEVQNQNKLSFLDVMVERLNNEELITYTTELK